MKKLLFVDNDDSLRSENDVLKVKNNLVFMGGLPEDYVNTISIISDFHRIDQDSAYKMMFDKNNVVCTWSMFTATHYGSLNQLFRFLRVAGGYDIVGVVHIDCSGQMIKTLKRDIRDLKSGTVDVLKAIESNYLITISSDWNTMERIRVNLSSDDIIVSEPVSLISLLQ